MEKAPRERGESYITGRAIPFGCHFTHIFYAPYFAVQLLPRGIVYLKRLLVRFWMLILPPSVGLRVSTRLDAGDQFRGETKSHLINSEKRSRFLTTRRQLHNITIMISYISLLPTRTVHKGQQRYFLHLYEMEHSEIESMFLRDDYFRCARDSTRDVCF